MSCDDDCSLLFSDVADSADSADVQELLTNTDWTYNRGFFELAGIGNRITDWIALEQDKHYYIDVKHVEVNGNDHMSLGVEIEDDDAINHHHAMKSLQEISATPRYQLFETI